MKSVLEDSSVVILAKDVNLSILKPLWLRRNGIFSDEELQGNIVFTPVNVLIPTGNWEFTALPDRLQLRFPSEHVGTHIDVSRTLGRIVKILPHIPYLAVGLNFDYLFGPDSQDSFPRWNQGLFKCPCSTPMPLSEGVDPRFGAYVSFNTLGMRLKADIKPIKAPNAPGSVSTSWPPGEDLMRAKLNFHSDVASAEAPAVMVLAALNKWEEASGLAKEIVTQIHN